MKPDWKDAPEWANWLAMDKCGDWFWYEEKPFLAMIDKNVWGSTKETNFSFAKNGLVDWRESLEEKPKT